jgi:serine-type D-Ala-D-Ala carboxypeptidase (penicillin-binding protein 5/6)
MQFLRGRASKKLMNRKYKIFIISLVFFLPFWWFVNAFNGRLESFWFVREISANQGFLGASLNNNFQDLKDLNEEKSFENKLNSLQINARSVLAVEVDKNWNSKILISQNSGRVLPIASLSKLMTALVVLELKETYHSADQVLITRDAIIQEGYFKYGNLIANEKITVENLLNKMLIESSNDSAYALAEYIGEQPFTDLMNLYAKKLGLNDTYFLNATGLDTNMFTSNVSTVEDLAELSETILQKYPEIFAITKKQSYNFLKPDGTLHHFIAENTNELLSDYPEIIGGKTGQTELANGCLLEVVKKPDDSGYYINVILGAEDRFAEMRKIIDAELK